MEVRTVRSRKRRVFCPLDLYHNRTGMRLDQQQTRVYWAAMSMNNMGVSMLSRHDYTGARETFRDAVALCDAVLEGGSLTSLSDIVEHKLKTVSLRLAKSRQVTHREAPNLHTEILVDGETPSPRTSLSTLEGRSQQSVFATYIDPSLGTSYTDWDTAVDSSSLLMNLGTAYRCLSKLSKSATEARRLLNGAVQLWRHAYLRLCARRKEVSNNSILCTNILEVSIVGLTNLIPGLIELNMKWEAREYTVVLLANVRLHSESVRQFYPAAAAA